MKRPAPRRVVALILFAALILDVYLKTGVLGAALAALLVVLLFAAIEAWGGMPKEDAGQVSSRWRRGK